MSIGGVADRFLADVDIAAKQSKQQGGIEQYSGIKALFQRWFGDGIEVKLEGRKDAVTISSRSACEFIKRNLDKSPKFANIEFIQSNLNDIVKRAKSPELQAVKIAIRTHGSISGKKQQMAEFVKLLKDAGLPISKEKEEAWFKSADIVEIPRQDLDEALKKCTNILISKFDPEIAKGIQAHQASLKGAASDKASTQAATSVPMATNIPKPPPPPEKKPQHHQAAAKPKADTKPKSPPKPYEATKPKADDEVNALNEAQKVQLKGSDDNDVVGRLKDLVNTKGKLLQALMELNGHSKEAIDTAQTLLGKIVGQTTPVKQDRAEATGKSIERSVRAAYRGESEEKKNLEEILRDIVKIARTQPPKK